MIYILFEVFLQRLNFQEIDYSSHTKVRYIMIDKLYRMRDLKPLVIAKVHRGM